MAPGPIPEVGHSVVFFARPGERRQGRDRFPALVLASNPDGVLSLLIFYDVDDVISLRAVPQRVGDENFGWAWPARDIVRDPLLQRVGDAIFGDEPLPEEPVVLTLGRLMARMEALEEYLGELRDPTKGRAAARKANEKARK